MPRPRGHGEGIGHCERRAPVIDAYASQPGRLISNEHDVALSRDPRCQDGLAVTGAALREYHLEPKRPRVAFPARAAQLGHRVRLGGPAHGYLAEPDGLHRGDLALEERGAAGASGDIRTKDRGAVTGALEGNPREQREAAIE